MLVSKESVELATEEAKTFWELLASSVGANLITEEIDQEILDALKKTPQ